MIKAINILCIGFTVVFFWSTLIVLLGLLKRRRVYPETTKYLRFAILICARNEANVIKRPIRSLLRCKYPSEKRSIIVLADNCTDETAAIAREAGATVWEKRTISHGKGDVLSWGINKIVEDGSYDAIAVFDADNSASDQWLCSVNNALQNGESVVTGCRYASNARSSLISGWYVVYWSMMNELSNRVRTNLGLSGKITGTGFAFLLSVLGPQGWKTCSLVEDVEFTIQTNLDGRRVAYVPEAEFADEQPETALMMWRQLRRWTTGGWEVTRLYLFKWIAALCKAPSLRLFDCYFAILTGMSVAFALLFDFISLGITYAKYGMSVQSMKFFFGIIGVVFVMGWLTAISAIALSKKKRRPRNISIWTFPVFSLILSMAVLFTVVFPTRRWKPIPHGAPTKGNKKW